MVGAGPKFGPNDTYWDFMPPLFHYVARIGSLLSQGEPAIRIAMLYDIRSIWAGGKDKTRAVKAHYRFAEALLKKQCDFDFIDEDQLANAEITRKGLLKIGKMTYSAVVFPTFFWLTTKAKKNLLKFKKANGQIITRTADLRLLPKTCKLTGANSSNIRVCKRSASSSAVYFFANESAEQTNVRIVLDETKGIVRCDPYTGDFIPLKAVGGRFNWTFEPFGSLLVMTGTGSNVPASKNYRGKTIVLDGDWKLRRILQYSVGEKEYIHTTFPDEQPRSVALGDWRPILGEEYSGKAMYSLVFSSYKSGKALLDLGRVCHACAVKFNGEDLPLKFAGPHTYEVRLKKGYNYLDVTVANALANAVGPDHIRDDVYKRFPPVSPYDRFTRIFDQDNHESGLYGPVKVTFLRS